MKAPSPFTLALLAVCTLASLSAAQSFTVTDLGSLALGGTIDVSYGRALNSAPLAPRVSRAPLPRSRRHHRRQLRTRPQQPWSSRRLVLYAVPCPARLFLDEDFRHARPRYLRRPEQHGVGHERFFASGRAG